MPDTFRFSARLEHGGQTAYFAEAVSRYLNGKFGSLEIAAGCVSPCRPSLRPSGMLYCYRASSHIDEAALVAPRNATQKGISMKKKLKRLTLSRETLRSLDEKHLAPAVGGTVFGTLMECTYLNCSEKCIIDPNTVLC